MNPLSRQQCFQPKTHVQNMCYSAAFDENPLKTTPMIILNFPPHHPPTRLKYIPLHLPKTACLQLSLNTPPNPLISQTFFPSPKTYTQNIKSLKSATHKLPPTTSPRRIYKHHQPTQTPQINHHEPMQLAPKPATIEPEGNTHERTQNAIRAILANNTHQAPQLP